MNTHLAAMRGGSLQQEMQIAHDTITNLKDEITGLCTTSKQASLAAAHSALQTSYKALEGRHKEQRTIKSTTLQLSNAELERLAANGSS